MKKCWMASTRHSITTTRWLKDRCGNTLSMRHNARSSSRWGFQFPWKPDLPRFSPRSGPAGSYVNSLSLRSLPLYLSFSLSLSRGYRITGVCLPSFPCFRFSFLFRRISRNFSSVPFDTRSLVAKVFFHSVTTKLFEIETSIVTEIRTDFFFIMHFAERESS